MNINYTSRLVIDGNAYDSFEAARRVHAPSLPLATLKARVGAAVTLGRPLTAALFAPTARPGRAGRPVTVNGKEYPTLVAAHEAVAVDGLSLSTLRVRLHHGWALTEALSTPVGARRLRAPRHVTAFGQVYESAAAFVEIEGPPGTPEERAKLLARMWNRKSGGASLEAALLKPLQCRDDSVVHALVVARRRLRKRTGPVTSREQRLRLEADIYNEE